MELIGDIYRPPSEAHSLLVQVTLGCSHNRCTFCANYRDKRFRMRPMEEVRRNLKEAARCYGNVVERAFLCDGNALVLPMARLVEILQIIRRDFPRCGRVGLYATARDILGKTAAELKELRELGLGILYIGLESGSDEVLRRVNKGSTSKEMIEAAQRAREAGIALSVMVITGLGGQALWESHARESARALNAMQPDYLGLLALMVEPGTELQAEVAAGTFQLLTPRQVVEEMALMVEGLELTDCFFSSIHASNYIALRGQLPGDKERLLRELAYYRNHEGQYRSEAFRRL